jgi:hypothetical protein
MMKRGSTIFTESPLAQVIEKAPQDPKAELEKIDNLQDFYMKYIQSKENVRKCRQFINDLFVSNSAEKTRFIERRVYSIDKNLQYNREIHFITESSFSMKNEKLVDSMNSQLMQSEWKDHELMRYFRLESAIQVGQRLESLSDLEKLIGDKQIRNLSIEEGRIWIIYIWTIYKSICKKQLKLLNDLFEKHMEWEGSVKIIAINTDLNRDYAIKSIKPLHLNKMEHLYIDSTKNPNHPLFNVANKFGYPVCILVNNDNIIDHCGSLFEINLELKIHHLLNRDLVTSNLNSTPVPETEKASMREIVKNLEDNCKTIKSQLNAPHLCGANFKVKKIYTAVSGNSYMKMKTAFIPLIKLPSSKFSTKLTRKMTLQNKNINLDKLQQEIKNITPKPSYQITYELDYFCHPSDDSIFQTLFRLDEKFTHLQVNKNYVETFEIMPAAEECYCERCDQNILTYINNVEDLNSEKENFDEFVERNNSTIMSSENTVTVNPQYYCSQCNEYYCKSCGDSMTNLNLPEQIHSHFIYLITPRNLNFCKFILKYNEDNCYDFDFKYFQQNRKTDHYINDVKTHYQVKCEGCFAFPIRTARWKCCNCLYKNICDNCMEYVNNKISPYYESIMKNFELVGCDPIQHVFTKIIFDGFVY